MISCIQQDWYALSPYLSLKIVNAVKYIHRWAYWAEHFSRHFVYVGHIMLGNKKKIRLGRKRALCTHQEGIINAFLGHDECIKRACYVHQGINWSSFEHYMGIFTHLVSCWCSKFALVMPTLKFPVIFSLFSHDARILHSFLRHHRASSVHHLWTVVALMVFWWLWFYMGKGILTHVCVLTVSMRC